MNAGPSPDWTFGPSYFDVLCLLITRVDPRVQMDDWTGAIFIPLDDGADLYATPGWEGESLPWTVWSSESDARCVSGNRLVHWTGRLREDLALYLTQLADLLNDNNTHHNHND